ncbi:hypothetical protein HHK36_008392 [Tetracentron sinense]|uniref:Uncharacterized protein n=1 Tax=Tetracentron sinense TaxID=13715 RepID=A0A835DN50_TETSI|nr:hypothetical protein HHK36_008392 [Tetracentron sinense]
MASLALQNLILICSLLICISSAQAQVSETSLQLINDALEWPLTSSLYDDLGDEEDADGEIDRRSLFWRRMHYYISYGALSANRIPCPPRSGRSYYTHNCYRARGPVHPYTRGYEMHGDMGVSVLLSCCFGEIELCYRERWIDGGGGN